MKKLNLLTLHEARLQKEQLLHIKGGVYALDELAEPGEGRKCSKHCVGCGDASTKKTNRKNM